VKKLIDHHPLLILLTMLVAAAGLGAYQYYPVHLQRKALRQTLAKQADKLDEIKGYSERLPTLHRQVKTLDGQAEEFARLFPADEGFSRLWHQIAEIMDNNHLADQLVRPGEVACEEDFCSIPLEIRCTGTFENMFEFFRAMEQFERLIRMDQVQLKNDETVTGRLILQAQARVFYQRSETPK
jgi:Tfp pilus assembly protein PilO